MQFQKNEERKIYTDKRSRSYFRWKKKVKRMSQVAAEKGKRKKKKGVEDKRKNLGEFRCPRQWYG